jgi:hypothetical protein
MRRLIVVLAALAVSACAQAGPSTSTGEVVPGDSIPNETSGTLRVDNQAFNDMTIYVIESSGQRSRIGTATGNTTTTLRIPARLLGGARALRFQADPIGGTQAPVSQEVSVIPGEVIVLTIPPRD